MAILNPGRSFLIPFWALAIGFLRVARHSGIGIVADHFDRVAEPGKSGRGTPTRSEKIRRD